MSEENFYPDISDSNFMCTIYNYYYTDEQPLCF